MAFELVDLIGGDLARSINIARKTGIGEAVWISGPTLETIEEKLTKSYETPHPIELVAFVKGIAPENVWTPTFAPKLEQVARRMTAFRRLWVISMHHDEIWFVYPKTGTDPSARV